MRIIGVIDVLAGQVVAARAGNRASYQPIRSLLCDGSDPAVIARAMRDQCDVHEFYLADLDRLNQRPANHDAWRKVGRIAKRLWIDAGITNPNDFNELAHVLGDISAPKYPDVTMIVASESWNDKNANVPEHHDIETAFSLDLKSGSVITPLERWSNAAPLDIARELIDKGWKRFIVLDVSAVGVAQGSPTIDLCRRLRQLSNDIEIVSGGGIRDQQDLSALEDAGCDGALVSTALHRTTLARRS